MPDLHPNATSIVPLITESTSAAQSIGACMFKDPCLMGVFPLSTFDIPKIVPINMISYVCSYDPWVIPLPSKIEPLGNTMLLSLAKLSYFAIQSRGDSVDTIFRTSSSKEPDQFFLPQWAQPLSFSQDYPQMKPFSKS